MKLNSSIAFAVLLFNFIGLNAFSQAEKNELTISIGYYNNNSQIHYLVAQAKSKIDGRFQQIPNVALSFYITNATIPNLLGKAVTNEKGEALLLIPPSAKNEWNKSAKQSFIVTSSASKQFDEATATLEITKAKIMIDTLPDKNIVATLFELMDSAWVPVKEVDLKVAIKRLGGDLNVNETPTYSTDSLGAVAAEFKREKLPGDANGYLTLIAKLDEHEIYGNITAEKLVPWGVVIKHASNFDKRTLFARRGHSPWWLELLAYSIVLAVWSILIYLIVQIKNIKKLGV